MKLCFRTIIFHLKYDKFINSYHKNNDKKLEYILLIAEGESTREGKGTDGDT